MFRCMGFLGDVCCLFCLEAAMCSEPQSVFLTCWQAWSLHAYPLAGTGGWGKVVWLSAKVDVHLLWRKLAWGPSPVLKIRMGSRADGWLSCLEHATQWARRREKWQVKVGETEDASSGFCPFCEPCGGLSKDEGRMCVGVCDKKYLRTLCMYLNM